MKTRKKDRGRASAEPWEVERLHREFPVKSSRELEEAAEKCKGEGRESETGDKLTRCVQRKLSQ
jgi:hypothetical protein